MEVKRNILERLIGQANKPFASILIGPRQVGKTVLLRMIQRQVQGPVVYLDAENPDDALVFRSGLRSLLDEVGRQRQTLLIDEFHRIPDALSLFKSVRDGYPGIKIYASGSSSLEIHKHLKQSGVGRVRRTRVFPLSFVEWLAERTDLMLQGWDIGKRIPPREEARLRGALDSFIVWGGMPELLHADDEAERREILREVVALYLEKDIRSMLGDPEALRYNEFLRLVAMHAGQIMNRASCGRDLAMNSRQVTKQLDLMQHTWLYRPIGTDYANPTKRLIKAPKIGWYDNGVRNALVKDFRSRKERPDGGALLENHLFTELEKASWPDIEILHHRTQDGQEIDFVLEKDRQKVLVEVKSTLPGPSVPPAIRELLGRSDVLAGVILNDNLHDTRTVDGKPVHFLPHFLAHRVPHLLD